MGTPQFAVEPLRAILQAGYHVIAVITAPDKPSGRGQKIQFSPVKEFALKHDLPVLQPLSLKNPLFIEQLRNMDANLQVVVAFRMLPEVVWQMPEFGTLNLHASLLPQYRGAAPINHAIMNGETETGLTTFFIEKEIDTGNIILKRKMPILPSDDAGTLHDKLMFAGGDVVTETLKLIETGNLTLQSQNSLSPDSSLLKPAPKIFKAGCRINWALPYETIHNFVRGLSPVPGAYTYLYTGSEAGRQVKIFKTNYRQAETKGEPGTVITNNKNSLSVVAGNGIIGIEELQMEGKKRMNTSEFLRGMPVSGNFRFD